jgi:hypothetical protein
MSKRPGMEDRAMIEKHLAQAEAHVLLGLGHIIRQKEILVQLERDGHEKSAVAARDLLATFELTHKAHLEDRDRLRGELAALD